MHDKSEEHQLATVTSPASVCGSILHIVVFFMKVYGSLHGSGGTFRGSNGCFHLRPQEKENEKISCETERREELAFWTRKRNNSYWDIFSERGTKTNVAKRQNTINCIPVPLYGGPRYYSDHTQPWAGAHQTWADQSRSEQIRSDHIRSDAISS